MFSGVLKVLVTIAIAVMVMPSVINAECVKITPKMWLDAPDSELVFGGKVVEVTDTGEVGSKATFEVERVWRGKVPRRFDVFMWYLASAEAPRYLEKGRSYVVVAKRLDVDLGHGKVIWQAGGDTL